jgi:hypothetical protein
MKSLDKRGWALATTLGLLGIAAIVFLATGTLGSGGGSHSRGGALALTAHNTAAGGGAGTTTGTTTGAGARPSSPARTAAAKTGGAAAAAARTGRHAEGATNDQSTATVTTGGVGGHHRSARGGAMPSAHGQVASLPPAKPAKAGVAGGGGLSVSPGVFEHTASPGGVGSIEISNTTSTAMAVKVALRPWLQSPSGEVSPNRTGTLPEVLAGASSFTLAPDSTQGLPITLTRTPSAGSRYGAIEVTGTPPGKATTSVKLAYRLISSLRLDAPTSAQSFHARAGRLVQQGSVGHGTLLLAVRNTGNTIVPIGGAVSLSGEGHSLSANATAKTVVPGQTVNMPLTELTSALSRGRYTVTVRLTQGGHSLGTVKRTITLR